MSFRRNIQFLSGSRSYWRHVENESDASHFTHDLFTSGDYCGETVHVANRRSLLENKELCDRLGIEELHESYSTDSILFPIVAIKDPEIIELFEKLEKYTLLDEEILSEIEAELEEQCFKDFGCHDFKKYLESKDLITEDQAFDISDKQLAAIYFRASCETNYNIFQVESGTSGYFNFESFGGLYEKSIEILKPIIKKELSNRN